jgi:AraC-like DNA-binding protein
MEGKVSELLALCLNELGRRDSHRENEIKLSGADVASLSEARRLLDASLSEPLLIRELSRMVGLNEYKLKKGFKQLYGIPVHAYLVEKRMEKARELLEQRNSTVSKIAEYVGYSCPSSFSKAFRKRYGFNPSDCFNSEKNSDWSK